MRSKIAVREEEARLHYEDGREDGRHAEHARLRPLMEQCEAVCCAQLHLNQGLRHPDGKAGALLGALLADLRRELGNEE